jgi:hypothetical protein
MDQMTCPIMPTDLEVTVIAQLPNGAKDTILILDHYQLQGLIHPEVFTSASARRETHLVSYPSRGES